MAHKTNVFQWFQNKSFPTVLSLSEMSPTRQAKIVLQKKTVRTQAGTGQSSLLWNSRRWTIKPSPETHHQSNPPTTEDQGSCVRGGSGRNCSRRHGNQWNIVINLNYRNKIISTPISRPMTREEVRRWGMVVLFVGGRASIIVTAFALKVMTTWVTTRFVLNVLDHKAGRQATKVQQWHNWDELDVVDKLYHVLIMQKMGMLLVLMWTVVPHEVDYSGVT